MKLRMEDHPKRDADAPEFDGARRNAFSALGSSLGARNLMIIIVTMPLVFLIVVVGILAVFGDPDGAGEAAAPASIPVASMAEDEIATAAGQRAVLPVPAAGSAGAAIALPAGAEAGAISLDGDRLAVRIDTQDGAMIVIYDLAAGAVVKTIPLVSEAGE